MNDERSMIPFTWLPTFEAAVKEAHVGAIMDSYNLVNGEHASQSAHLNTEIAKKEWGFEGLIMSDWFATYDGVAAANSGMDLEMPSGAFMNRKTLIPAIREGKRLPPRKRANWLRRQVQDKGAKGLPIKVTHEKGVASKIQITAKKAEN